MPESALLDCERLDTFLVIGIDYNDLLNDVVEEVPQQLDELRQALAAGDYGHLKSVAHALRGPLAYCGCVAITERLASIEFEASQPPGQRSLNPEDAAAIHAELGELWQQSLAAIKDWEKSVSP